MKLCTSTGDFSYYVDNVTEKIKSFKGLKFKYINLEQTGKFKGYTDYDKIFVGGQEEALTFFNTNLNKVKSENRMIDKQIKETNKLIDSRKKYAKNSIGSSAVKNKITATTSTSKISPVKPIKSAINKIAAKTRIKR